MRNIIIGFITLISFLLSFFPYTIHAQDEIHHVIISLDRSGSMVHPDGDYSYRDENVAQVKSLIKEVIEYTKKKDSKGRPLLQDGDYLSFVGWGLDKGDDSLNNYVVKNFGFKYNTISANSSTSIDNLYKKISRLVTRGVFSKNWSIVSISQQITLKYLYNDTAFINRTFMFLITDKEFNGENMDPIQELSKTKEGYGNSLRIENVLTKCQQVRENYIWNRYPPEKPFENSVSKKPGYDRIYATCFEYTPLQKFFAIESCFRFENREAFFKRAFDGYRYKFELENLNNSNYDLLGLDSYVESGKKQLSLHTFSKGIPIPSTIDFHLDRSEFGNADTLVLKFTMRFKENAYGASILYPKGSIMQGAKGLVRKIPISFEKNMKILNRFELDDEKYLEYAKSGFDDQTLILNKWNNKYILYLVGIILVILLIGLIIYIARSHKTKKPEEIT